MSTVKPPRSGGGAALVAAGILLSRVFGLVRSRLIGHFLGVGDAADALTQAIRIPNVLQNLFGEGVLSASFIPVYARLVADGDEEEAGRVAGAVGTLLALTSAVIVLVGIVITPYAMPLIAPGFAAEKRELTILLVRIMFPGVGILVCSAWTLGILNSHRRFFLSYASPVAMNVVMIATLLWAGPDLHDSTNGRVTLVTMLAWASVIGSAAQFAVQVPTVLRVERKLRLSLDLQSQHVRTVVKNFAPVFVGRGVVQISSYVDGAIASLISTGAAAILGYAQVIAILPLSLFGMAVSAAALPAMSSDRGSETEIAAALRQRLADGLERIAFFVVPSVVAFLAIGDIVGALLNQSGHFGRSEVVWMWGVLAGSAVGLLAGTMGRLYSSTWHALRDTRTPLKFAVLRVALTLVLGWPAALYLPAWLGLDPKWGVAGLTATSGIAAWVEFALLRRSLAHRIGSADFSMRYVMTLWFCAALAAAAAWGVKLGLGVERPLLLGLVALPVYGAVYFGATALFDVPESRALLGRVRRLSGRR